MKKPRPQTHKSINKQYMLPKYKIPTNERKKEIEQIYFDTQILRIYVDASELRYQGIFGLGVTFVGAGEIKVKSKKIYNVKSRRQIWFGETMAICYALELIPLVFTAFEENINEINIFSDLKMLQTLDESNNKTSLFIKEQMESPLMNLYRILDNDLTVRVQYLENADKRFNPYYKAAHNAARKAIGLIR
jgi:hypothetical protein